MKVFISVDIEGVTGTTAWSETTADNREYAAFADQMTKETIAACEGAIAMGADEIVVRDAHDSARNIDFSKLPRCVKLIRGWMGTPDSMVEGLDETFDAAIFVGYHAGAEYEGNPLSHTMNGGNNYIKVNGVRASEFLINAYTAAGYGVPVVLVSGDKMLCDTVKELNEAIETVAVKEGIGGATININPEYACDLIRDGVKKGLKHIESCKLQIPEKFEVEISYKEHRSAKRAACYPGVTQTGPRTVIYSASNVSEFITTRMFIL